MLDDIGKLPADSSDSPQWVVPAQPALRLIGVEIMQVSPSFDVSAPARMRVFKGTSSAPMLLFDSGYQESGLFFAHVDCVIEGNFKVLVERQSGPFGAASKLLVLWHNTLFIER